MRAVTSTTPTRASSSSSSFPSCSFRSRPDPAGRDARQAALGLRSASRSGRGRSKALWFLGITTAANVVIGSQLSYRAVEHMETTQFCGQSCHVMKPEFTAHAAAPHAKVACVSCHVSPGATGWMHAKINGTRQLYQVVTNSFPRPIAAGLASGRLVGSEETCESCHDRDTGRPLRLGGQAQACGRRSQPRPPGRSSR